MSLVNSLLNGGTYGVDIDASKYTHSDGATRIATESIAELHEIFLEGFYNVEQAEMAAATEGVVFEGSKYEAVAEAASNGVISKIKEFLSNLWAKIKAFFHNLKRFLDAIFMSGSDFVKKYKDDIKAIGSLKDFNVKLYDYNNTLIDDPKLDVVAIAGQIVTETHVDVYLKALEGCATVLSGNDEDRKAKVRATVEKHEATVNSMIGDGEVDKLICKAIIDKLGGKYTGVEDYNTNLFAAFRNGAESQEDKDEITVSNVDKYYTILSNSSKLQGTLNKLQSSTDKAFRDASKEVDVLAKDAENVAGAAPIARALRVYVSMFSNITSKATTAINAWKAAAKERDTSYKTVIMAAFSVSKKQNKKK